MKNKLLVFAAVAAALLAIMPSCKKDQGEVHFVCVVGIYDPQPGRPSPYDFTADGGKLLVPISVGYSYDGDYKMMNSSKLVIAVEGEGFGFEEAEGEDGPRWIRILVDGGYTGTEVRHGKLLITASKSGKPETFEVELAQYPVGVDRPIYEGPGQLWLHR